MNDSENPSTARREVYSVARLNREVRRLLESGFARIWVEGEISNLARPSSGHLYFTLKDAGAQISCALFRNRAARLAFPLDNGAQVLAQAQVSLYEARGNYQLIVDRLEPVGDGALRRAFEALKHQLQAEGLFAPEHKRPLPAWPRCLGVITAPGGAAIRDVLTVLRRRFAALPVIVYPTLVQGAGAAAGIIAALQQAQRHGRCDVLLLTRGGGSLEDLWPFNEAAVARAIHACQVPLVSAVGHEIDFVISDFVADARAATPSAAAELLSPDGDQVARRCAQTRAALGQHMQRTLRQRRERLQWLLGRARLCSPTRRLQQHSQRLDELRLRLLRAWQQAQAGRAARLDAATARWRQQNPGTRLQALRSGTAELAQRLKYCINIQLSMRRERLAGLSRALDAISPLSTLRRGYSITSADGRILRRAAQTRVGEKLETRLAHGRVISQVCEVEG